MRNSTRRMRAGSDAGAGEADADASDERVVRVGVARGARASARARCRARRNEAEEMFRGAFEVFAAASLRAIGGVASDVVGGERMPIGFPSGRARTWRWSWRMIR